MTDVKRTKRTLDFQESTIEAALDSGTIASRDGKEAVHELELELRKNGAPGALYGLALCLNAVTPRLAATASVNGARQPR